MASLSDEIKQFIVVRIACYDSPQEVADAVKEEFGVEIDRNQTGSYDPTRSKGKTLGKKWKEVFTRTREQLLKDLSTIPLANPSVRVRELTKLYHLARKNKNSVLAAQHLEQIAKEAGGAYTNKIRLAGATDPGDAPIQHEHKHSGAIQLLRQKQKAHGE
ncbi:DUF2280 domain-containing protein [Pseudomethylobacillus aquaticus]|uniref:DUF2280 domain-containing protein n=1 Tax=Pseudomethylobacillus aquaticus TaxID=2676064 RepID=A0A3N0V5P5_9PROT|nr:DUF2280 domain-containing protein [Pseudomethylobacillus aquaticus]ROH87995.1 DUF2280 domain-containing protein [Pseudomethylobacillus aquaticus]